MDGAGGHYPKQNNAGTENQVPHVLTHKWKLNIEYIWTQRETTDTGFYFQAKGGRRVKIQNTYRLGTVAHDSNPSTFGRLRSGVQDQLGQHGNTPSLLKIQKLSGTVAGTCNPSLSGG